MFGTNAKGQDIFTRLAAGARFSFLLAISISAINLFIGAIYGAIEGYYGGAVDLVMERIADVINGVPFIVVTTLFQLHLANKVGVVPALLFRLCDHGVDWHAARVRMQFLPFQGGQEYILAARTLGASGLAADVQAHLPQLPGHHHHRFGAGDSRRYLLPKAP